VTESGTQFTESRVPQTVARQRRVRAVWDVAISIALVVVANVSFLIGAIFAILSVGFSQDCSSGCHTTSAMSVLFATGAILALVGVLGSVLTIVFLVRRRRAWWIALSTMLLVVIGWIVGFLVFAATLNLR
jgi:hypothetical protein